MVLVRVSPVLQGCIDAHNIKGQGDKIEAQIIKQNNYLEYRLVRMLADEQKLQLRELFDPHTDLLLSLQAEQLQQPEPSAEHKRLMLELRNKHERRIYDRLVDKKNADRNYFVRESDRGVKDLEKTISFAMTFIFSFLLAGVTGFCLGRYFFGWEHIESMKLAIGFIVMTIFVETTLFIIKVNKMTEIETKKRKVQSQRYYNYTVRESTRNQQQQQPDKKHQ